MCASRLGGAVRTLGVRVKPKEGLASSDSAVAEAQPPLAPGSGYTGTKYWRGVAVLYVTCIAHSYAVASVMSYVGFYAVDSGWATDVDAAGFVAGLLASAMPFGRIPASIAWGAAIDRFGTRDCLVASMCSLVVGHLVFALCRPLWAAMLARAVFLGAGNGFMALMAALILEVGGFDRQAHVIGYVTGGGTLMGLMGPAIGAFSYGAPSQFPALAPSMIGCVFAVAGAVLAWCWLPPRAAAPPPAATAAAAAAPAPEHVPLRRILCTKPMLLTMLLRAGSGFALFASFELVPLFAIASHDAGGVALDRQQCGLLLSASMVLVSIYSTFFQGRLANRLGLRVSIVGAGALGTISLAALAPLRAVPVAVVPAVAGVFMAFTMGSSQSICLSNVVAERHAGRQGRLNGVITAADGVGKALGPLLAAPLIAASLTSHEPEPGFPKSVFLFFVAFAALVGGIHASALALPPSVDAPREAPPPLPPAEASDEAASKAAEEPQAEV